MNNKHYQVSVHKSTEPRWRAAVYVAAHLGAGRKGACVRCCKALHIAGALPPTPQTFPKRALVVGCACCVIYFRKAGNEPSVSCSLACIV